MLLVHITMRRWNVLGTTPFDGEVLALSEPCSEHIRVLAARSHIQLICGQIALTLATAEMIHAQLGGADLISGSTRVSRPSNSLLAFRSLKLFDSEFFARLFSGSCLHLISPI